MYKLYIENINDYNIEDAIKYLTNDILNKCMKNKDEFKRKQSIIGYYLLRKYLIQDYNINLEYINVNEYGKPYINDIYFSISHSNQLVAIMISDFECGIDIEISNPKNLRLYRKILNYSEIQMLEEYSDDYKLDYIMRKWVSIEAKSKMIGKTFNLDINVDNIGQLLDTNTNDKYYIAVYEKQL